MKNNQLYYIHYYLFLYQKNLNFYIINLYCWYDNFIIIEPIIITKVIEYPFFDQPNDNS